MMLYKLLRTLLVFLIAFILIQMVFTISINIAYSFNETFFTQTIFRQIDWSEWGADHANNWQEANFFNNRIAMTLVCVVYSMGFNALLSVIVAIIYFIKSKID